MNIYTDYANWKFENFDFINNLVKNKSKSISRISSVIAVVDYLYEKYVENKKLTEDEEIFFSIGFDYIYDQFYLLKTLFELKFNNSFKEMEKYSKTINLLLYINEFQSEALEYENIDITPLDDLEDKVNKCLDKKENAPDEYFQILNEVNESIFEKNNIEVHTMDQIFYEIAIEYGIYKENDYDLYNEILNRQIEKTRKAE